MAQTTTHKGYGTIVTALSTELNALATALATATATVAFATIDNTTNLDLSARPHPHV